MYGAYKIASINQRTVDSSIWREHVAILLRFVQKVFSFFDLGPTAFSPHLLFSWAYRSCISHFFPSIFLYSSLSVGIIYLPFCIIWALEKPDSSTKPSEQYTIGCPATWAFPSTKFESETRRRKKERKIERERDREEFANIIMAQ